MTFEDLAVERLATALAHHGRLTMSWGLEYPITVSIERPEENTTLHDQRAARAFYRFAPEALHGLEDFVAELERSGSYIPC